MRHFLQLSRPEQRAAIVRLSLSGLSDSSIARATGLSTEMICRLLSESTANTTT
jgi:DNA-directed RNA polymerase specialized sigma24 family protein